MLNILQHLPILEKEGSIKRRYQHPDAVLYTPEGQGRLDAVDQAVFLF